jgi:CheY-like chemotaxis protein
MPEKPFEPGTAKTVLIVEDNDIEREGTAAILRQAGYAVLPAPSVDVALAASVAGGRWQEPVALTSTGMVRSLT